MPLIISLGLSFSYIGILSDLIFVLSHPTLGGDLPPLSHGIEINTKQQKAKMKKTLLNKYLRTINLWKFTTLN